MSIPIQSLLERQFAEPSVRFQRASYRADRIDEPSELLHGLTSAPHHRPHQLIDLEDVGELPDFRSIGVRFRTMVRNPTIWPTAPKYPQVWREPPVLELPINEGCSPEKAAAGDRSAAHFAIVYRRSPQHNKSSCRSFFDQPETILRQPFAVVICFGEEFTSSVNRSTHASATRQLDSPKRIRWENASLRSRLPLHVTCDRGARLVIFEGLNVEVVRRNDIRIASVGRRRRSERDKMIGRLERSGKALKNLRLQRTLSLASAYAAATQQLVSRAHNSV